MADNDHVHEHPYRIEATDGIVTEADLARMKEEMATLSRGWGGSRRNRSEIVTEHTRRVAEAKESARAGIAEFESAAGMSAEFFCHFVVRREKEGADYADMAEELTDPRRSIEFTQDSVKKLFDDLSSDLSTLGNWRWRYDTPAAPAIPPKEPTKEHPAGIPYISLKTFEMNGSGLAERISERKAASRTSGIPEIPPRDDVPGEGPRLG